MLTFSLAKGVASGTFHSGDRGLCSKHRKEPARKTRTLTNKLLSLVVARCATCYCSLMIKSFRHKGLKRFYSTGNISGIQPDHAKKLRMQLTALDTATSVDDMDIPGFRLHPLKGKDKGRWSIRVNGNWRMTFEFQDGNAYILDYEDYH